MFSNLENYTFVPVIDRYYAAMYALLAFEGKAATADEVAEIVENYKADGNGSYISWSTEQLIEDLRNLGYNVKLVDTEIRYFV